MLKFAVDENFNMHIVNGVLRRQTDVDIVSVQGVGLEGASDPQVLEWTASEGRILLTHDLNTITAHAYERVTQGLPMPGVLEVSFKVPVSVAIRLLAKINLACLEAGYARP